jgi:hypothetical protein
MIGREERLYVNFAGRELPMTFNLLSLPDSERSAVGYVGEPWPAVRHLMEDHRADTGRFARPLPIAQLFRFFVYTSGMSLRTPAEITALRLLDRDGIAAIWGLLAAAAAHRDGRKAVAAAIIEIATAAEQAWLRREGTRMLKG